MSAEGIDEPRATRREIKHRRRRRFRMLGVTVSAVGAVAIAAGFFFWSGLETSVPARTTTSPNAATDAKPAPPADDALARFANAVDIAVARSAEHTSGASIRSALAEHGFDAARVEYTSDRTSVDLVASAIAVSYKEGDATCLIAQVQTADRTTSFKALPPIASGTCLIGSTETTPRR
jgi:uncharacterized protein DUF6993